MKKELAQELKKYREHSNEKSMKQLIENCDDIKHVDKLSIVELDVIALVAKKNLKINDLLQYVNMTQGAMSKLVNRLVKYSFVEKYHRVDNKKDTYLRVTDLGKEVEEIHRKFHQKLNDRLEQVLHQFSKQDIETTITVLRAINEARDELD
jgi:DNA-binding MarR family transcriptional regulator